MRKYGWLILFFSLLILLIIGYSGRNTLNNFISEKMKEQAAPVDVNLVENHIETNYNYVKTRQLFEFTLLEFGSGNCVTCKQMEPVLEEIKNLSDLKVNVVFLNIMHPENLAMMKYFGISAVPLQILLDKNGKERFRHYGYISASDLISRMNSF